MAGTRNAHEPHETPNTEQETMTKQNEYAQETFRNLNLFVDPWVKAMKSWASESEKLQQSAVDTMHKALDNGHKLGREGVEMMAGLSATMQRQVSDQVERTISMMGSFMQQQ